MQTFSSSTPIAAPREIAWEVMTSHELYARWTPSSRVDLEIEGSPEPNGVGAVRAFRTGPVSTREEVTVFEPPYRMVYRLLNAPLPIRNYRSEMMLVGEDGGDSCQLHWDSWFDIVIPLTGGILRQLMASAVAKMAAGIAEEAQHRAQSA
ncbi:MAG: SRPBCC family protein [bacterium]|nr:SRPBCC family protein [bacterium]